MYVEDLAVGTFSIESLFLGMYLKFPPVVVTICSELASFVWMTVSECTEDGLADNSRVLAISSLAGWLEG